MVSYLTTASHNLVEFGVLHNLEKLENRPWRLSKMAYRWCALIWENRQTCWGWEELILLFLEVGFRHPPPGKSRTGTLIHTEHHRGVVETVFKSNDSEAIADLLFALTTTDHFHRRATYTTLLDICTGYIANLHNRVTVPFSPRLWQHVMDFIELLGYRRFEGVDAEEFVDLLNNLHLGIKDMDRPKKWGRILLRAMESSKGVQHLVIQSWELLVELQILYFPFAYPWSSEDVIRCQHVVDSLSASQQWDKLECWMGALWMSVPIREDMVGILESETVSLFRRRPCAVQKLTEWVERYCIEGRGGEALESFQ